MKTICVAGKFDPIHGGHIEHIIRARALGDKLIVITHNDDVLQKVKGKVNFPLRQRVRWLNELKSVNEVFFSIDADGTVGKTLRYLKPDIFAKGGDRTPNNMPQNEIDACEELGIEIVYGVSPQLASSTELMDGRKH